MLANALSLSVVFKESPRLKSRIIRVRLYARQSWADKWTDKVGLLNALIKKVGWMYANFFEQCGSQFSATLNLHLTLKFTHYP
jgi:hypothetical protein